MLIEAIASTLAASVQASAAPGFLHRRDAHPKHHGVVQAWFTVAPDVPEPLRHGVFATPHTYAAWIRFSNGKPHVQADASRDQRGMAIKLMNVPGAKLLDDERFTQDFVLASTPRFFLRTVADYVVFARAALKKPAIRVFGFFVGMNPPHWRWYEFKALLESLKKADDLLTTRYWSQTPYRLGPHVVKYTAIPTSPGPGLRASRSPDYLRENLAAHLRSGEATFDFAVQVFADPLTTPIEDATVEWPESTVPFQKVATIRIPKQEFQSPRQMALAEFISYTAWHSLPAHEPLGAVNRTRRAVYATVSALRHRLNGVPHHEPVSHDDLGHFPVLPETASHASGGHVVRRVLVAAGLLFVAVVGWSLWPSKKDLQLSITYPPPPSGSNGLTPQERQQDYHLTEGGELYPISWLLALEQKTLGADGRLQYRPFLDNIERYQLIPDPPSRYNPYGLPVGVTMGYDELSGMQMMGLNCTACHVGELHYNGRAVRIDGAPNMAFINNFVVGMLNETVETIRDPERLARFLDRRRRVKLVELPLFPVVSAEDVLTPKGDPDELLDSGRTGLWRVVDRLRSAVTSNRGLLESKIATLKTLKILQSAMSLGTPDGYGRVDAFGIGRDELFGGFGARDFTKGVDAAAPDAPVSFPHLWGIRQTYWFEWGANTNSVIQRNIGQALGVGATFDEHGWSTTARLDHLHAMESLSYRLTPPKWPEDILGPIDTAKAAQGKAIFDRTCALCHETYKKVGELNEYQLFPLNVVGTDPNTAINFERTVMTANGPQPFGTAAFTIVKNVLRCVLQDARYFRRAAGGMGRSGPPARSGVSHALAQLRGVRGHETPRRLPREDAQRHLGHGAVPAQRVGTDDLRLAAPGSRPAQDVPDGHTGIRSAQARLRDRRRAFPDTQGHAAVHARHASAGQLEHRTRVVVLSGVELERRHAVPDYRVLEDVHRGGRLLGQPSPGRQATRRRPRALHAREIAGRPLARGETRSIRCLDVVGIARRAHVRRNDGLVTGGIDGGHAEDEIVDERIRQGALP